MKKVSISILSTACLLFIGTGCLKDKNFEDQKYGIQVAEVKGVAFPEAPNSPLMGSINSQATPLVFQGPTLTLEQDGAATSDVTVTLTLNEALVADAGLTLLPASAYTVNTSIVIPAGQKFSEGLKINIPNSSALDPTETYGLGFTISAVSNGYTIAANMKNVVIGFTIKNKYDGVYKLRVRTTGWSAFGIADGVTNTYPEDFDIITVGANSVSSFSNYRGDNLLPAFTSANAPTAFGATTPLFIFDPATDALVDVQNTTPDDGRGRVLQLNPAVTDSRYDAASKTIFASFIMKQNGRPNQVFYDTLTFIKER